MTVDEYIAQFPTSVQDRLVVIRALIHEQAPEAVESMAYGMPAYKMNGKPLIYFAGYANHVGLYATPAGHTAFEKEFTQYKQGKGSVQFPHNQPLPAELISRVVRFRVNELA